MSNVPSFFVPNVINGTDEEKAFAELARFVGVTVPDATTRIYSIEFEHNGETWIAEVGSKLKGSKNKKTSAGRQLADYERILSDSATVLAIFSSSPTIVVTDTRPVGNINSQWNNPFLAGNVKRIVTFSK